MVKGIGLISWDVVEGGRIKMKYPEDLDIPPNIVQQLQISHNFTESYIITEEENWNSISFYNEDKELIIVLVLEKYDDGQDYKSVLSEFNKAVEKETLSLLSETSDIEGDVKEREESADVQGEQLKGELKRIYDFSLNVFRTRDEVISKLSNEVAHLRTMEYDYQKKFEKITRSNNLTVKSKIQFLLVINDYLTFEDLQEKIDTSKYWLSKVLDSLQEERIIGYNAEKESYFLNF
ncbi:MAG: hypothetical protein BAJALOKI3v1_680028 [Promethearchaeota archaeon]|nr:MAG: hypothetical protein BAJALOKI3v1_680028 [Candidatus Lokiarchaeota archaeon]